MRRIQQLLAGFDVPTNAPEAGFDAVELLPKGQILFSIRGNVVAAGLKLGRGDLSSDRGQGFRTHAQLRANSDPTVTTQDYGLAAMFLVTDLNPPAPPAALLGIHHDRPSHRVRLDRDGAGALFEVQRATRLTGPWESRSPILPDLSFEEGCKGTGDAQFFYRLQQW